MIARSWLFWVTACFFAGAYIYADRIAPPDIRHSVQTVFGIVILGGGPVLGGILSGWLADRYHSTSGGVDFASLWRVVAFLGLATAIGFYLFFRERPPDRAEPTVASA